MTLLKIGYVSELCVYPLKSCKPSLVTSAVSTADGLVTEDGLCDRHMLVVEADSGRMVTAKTEPKLVQVEVKKTDKGVRLSAPSMNDIVVDLTDAEQSNKRVRAM